MLTTPLVPKELPSKFILRLQCKHQTNSTADEGDAGPVDEATLPERVWGFETVLDLRLSG